TSISRVDYPVIKLHSQPPARSRRSLPYMSLNHQLKFYIRRRRPRGPQIIHQSTTVAHALHQSAHRLMNSRLQFARAMSHILSYLIWRAEDCPRDGELRLHRISRPAEYSFCVDIDRTIDDAAGTGQPSDPGQIQLSNKPR